jgi:hypothetical protein
VALCGALVVATGVGTAPAPPGRQGHPLVTSIPTPLATSIGSSSGTWATLPMGRTNQPLNTFWQLFFQPAGATSWTDEVGATATATNGGLVLATAVGRPFIAGIRPANLLRFSPLISTTDGGVTWTNGVLPRGLSAHPDSLSTASERPDVGTRQQRSRRARAGQLGEPLDLADAGDGAKPCRPARRPELRTALGVRRGITRRQPGRRR